MSQCHFTYQNPTWNLLGSNSVFRHEQVCGEKEEYVDKSLKMGARMKEKKVSAMIRIYQVHKNTDKEQTK